jgi:hypothetical protein
MKEFLIFMTVITFVSCATKEPRQLTPQELEDAKKEIKDVSDQIISAADKLDMNAFFKDFSNTPEFIFVGTDGTSYDFQSYVEMSKEFVKPLLASSFILKKTDFRVLSNDLMLNIMSGSWDLTMPGGDHLKFDTYTITCLFKKIDNQWKVIFMHESASPPVETPKIIEEGK